MLQEFLCFLLALTTVPDSICALVLNLPSSITAAYRSSTVANLSIPVLFKASAKFSLASAAFKFKTSRDRPRVSSLLIMLFIPEGRTAASPI